MNKITSTVYPSPTNKIHLQLDLQDGFPKDNYALPLRNNNLSTPRVLQHNELIGQPLSYTQQHTHSQFHRKVSKSPLRKEKSFQAKKDEDLLSPFGKREEKHIKRQLKNEKNFNDLNKSLANLALKRVNYDFTSEKDGMLYQNKIQPETCNYLGSHTSEVLPHNGLRNIPATTKHSSISFNAAFYSIPEYKGESYQFPHQISEKKPPSYHHSPKRGKSPRKIELDKLEPDFIRSVDVTPKGSYQPFLHSYNTIDVGMIHNEKEAVRNELRFQNRLNNNKHTLNSDGAEKGSPFKKDASTQYSSYEYEKLVTYEVDINSKTSSPIHKRDNLFDPSFSFKDAIVSKEEKSNEIPIKQEISQREPTAFQFPLAQHKSQPTHESTEKINSFQKFFATQYSADERMLTTETDSKSKISSPKHKKDNPFDSSLSFKDVTVLQEGRKILETRLPSKLELSEMQSIRRPEGSMVFHDRIASWGGTLNQQTLREESATRKSRATLERSPKRRFEKRSLTPVEKKILDAWKPDILEIKNEMEERQKSYKERKQFYQIWKNGDVAKPNEEINSGSIQNVKKEENDVNINIIFSSSNMSKYDSRSSDMLTTGPVTPKSNRKTQKQSLSKRAQVSFDLTGNLGGNTSPERYPKNPSKSPGPRIRKQAGSYFEYNQNNNDRSINNTQNSHTPTTAPSNFAEENPNCQMF